jgi:hypothetical protein
VPGPKNSTKQKPGRELLEFCRDRRDVLRFTADTSIWPTNNISERGVRPLKTQQKISGRLAVVWSLVQRSEPRPAPEQGRT